jgi:hypothetical protein
MHDILIIIAIFALPLADAGYFSGIEMELGFPWPDTKNRCAIAFV